MKIKHSLLLSASALLLATYSPNLAYANDNLRTAENIQSEFVFFNNQEDILVYQIKKDDTLNQIAAALKIDDQTLEKINELADNRLDYQGSFVTLIKERYLLVADAFFHEVVVFDLETADPETNEPFSKIKPTDELKRIIKDLHDHYHVHNDHDHSHDGHNHNHSHDGHGHSHHGHDHNHSHDGHGHSHHGHDHNHSHDSHNHSHGDHGHSHHEHDHNHSHDSHDHFHNEHEHNHSHNEHKHNHSHGDHNHSHDDHDHIHHHGHNHDDLKIGMEALEKLGIDHEIVHALVHSDSTIPFPANETDPEKLKTYLASVKAINIGEITNPLQRKGLEFIPNIEVLGIGFTPITDVSPVLQFKNLKQLWMTATGIKNYDFLHQFKHLEGIDISQNNLESIDFLSEFPNLKVVAAAGNNLTNDKVQVLKSLLKIEGLNLDYNELTSLDFLKEHENLRILSVENNQLTSLEGVTSTNLEGIFASHNQITDLAPLANKEKLESIIANDNQITSLASLENVPSLGMLNVDNNAIESNDDIKRLEAEKVTVTAKNNPGVPQPTEIQETSETSSIDN